MNIKQLKFKWINLLEELKANLKVGEKIFLNIINSYSVPERHYHNLNHIQQVLAIAEEMKLLAKNSQAIQLAAWFHDIVYLPENQDNEEKSAVYAEDILSQLQVDYPTINLTKELILNTNSHKYDSDNIDIKIFLDADLSILGSASSEYQIYAQAIRQEYAWLSNEEYHQGRKKVLRNFLSRERIYLTEYLFNKLEHQARLNIQAELISL
jgi:predicted metal-dependent HD superfamily phosphohydrolase